MRLGHIDRFSIVLMPMCDIVSLKTDSRSNWPVAALMESSSILPCSSGILRRWQWGGNTCGLLAPIVRSVLLQSCITGHSNNLTIGQRALTTIAAHTTRGHAL